MDVCFQDGGEISVKNIDRPIQVWRWYPGTTPAMAQRSGAANVAPNVANASIAVLPFTTCPAIRSRSISPTVSARTSSPTCRRLPA
jgi:hypothetical protein